MVNTRLLMSEIVKQGYNRKEFCSLINMPQSTFCRRLKTGIFKTDEAQRIMQVLSIENPDKIFFANDLTY